MRLTCVACAIAMAAATISAGAADKAKDVPEKHWARKDVDAVLDHSVMIAPAGKFRGDDRITRTELILAMAAFARSLERGEWTTATGKSFKSLESDDPSSSISKNVTRYEAAAVITRFARFAAVGIPKGPARFSKSVVLPKAEPISTVKASHPAYSSVQYLAQNRMIPPGSILGKPGQQPVTGRELAAAVASVITGLIDIRTDEPQNREDLGPPPSRGEPKRPARS
jgi:hypothetical protein